ncbi:hypothetical protein PV08_03784 [Exophiala spinifera]|uniref:DUF300-domain-containing protein n=1 Tax=Exophiala spinifera TaxID=91928 RepID=A0A0D1YNE6_9EURO|nr:uncharacterized protein PV08_03784 [Exophiala spinifera]KIW16596.1 hypothetical protein PV08_03784 [Exophiala spinifera]
MGWPKCNTTLEDMQITEEPIWHDKSFHDLGLYLGAIFTFIAIAVSFFLIMMHATHYQKPWEQRHIIRILFMVPVYAAVSLLSYYYYNHSVYFEVIRDCYEAFAIASFFSLLCAYIAPDLHQQKIYFRTITPRKWVWPIPWFQKCTGGSEKGILRTPRSGLTWFNVIWVSVFQYCFIRVFFTLVAVATQAADIYCLESLNPAFAHIWTMVFESVGVTIAMYCLIQFYIQIKDDIRRHKPLLKITAIKLVIFLSFWQSTLISFLTSSGAIKSTSKIQTPDIKVGIPALLLCIEMAFFAIFHVWSFSWKPYTLGSKELMAEAVPGDRLTYQGGFLGVKALWDSFNAWDMLKATGRSARWLFKGRKHRHTDASYDMTRKNTTGSEYAGSQKLSNFDGNTTYTGPAQPPHYGEEGDNLLSNSQGMAITRPEIPRRDSDPNEAPMYYEQGDIGIATTTYDDKYTPQQYNSPRPPPQQHYSQYAPYQGTDGQESGVSSSAPYPYSTREASGQASSRDNNRISMPYMPPPRSRQPEQSYPYPSPHDNRDNFL